MILNSMVVAVLGVVGVLLLASGSIMIIQGLNGRKLISQELANQKIVFPPAGEMPAELASHAGTRVLSGEQAKAYSDFIASRVTLATDGLTYAEIIDQWTASGRKDERLGKLRETAFTGETLRGALLGAYQASQITLLVLGMGALFIACGAAFLTLAFQS